MSQSDGRLSWICLWTSSDTLLSLPACVPSRSTELLRAGNKFFCDTCSCLQEAEKRLRIYQLPTVLTLHLKRFKYVERQAESPRFSFDDFVDACCSVESVLFDVQTLRSGKREVCDRILLFTCSRGAFDSSCLAVWKREAVLWPSPVHCAVHHHGAWLGAETIERLMLVAPRGVVSVTDDIGLIPCGESESFGQHTCHSSTHSASLPGRDCRQHRQ